MIYFKNTILLSILLFFVACGGSSSSSKSVSSSVSESSESTSSSASEASKRCDYLLDKGLSHEDVEPVFVSVVLHYEETFSSMTSQFFKHRKNLIDLAVFLRENNITLNLQPDWAFMQAIEDYEDDKMRATTNGKNILRYLSEDLDHEIDPHAHEHGYNYADVAYMINNLGVKPTNLVGGLIVDPPEDSKYDYLKEPIAANHFDYTWKAEWLWGGGTSGHTHDTHVAGVWKPKGAYNFYENDDTASLPCIGRYDNEIDGVYDLIERIKNGEIEKRKIMTASIFIGQGEVVEKRRLIALELEKLKSYEKDKKIIFARLSEVAHVWQECYEAKGFLYFHP